MTLTALETHFGPSYLLIEDVIYIGPLIQNPKYGDSRELRLRHGGGGVYIKDSTYNHAKLKHLLPADAPALAKAAPAPKGKRAGAKKEVK